MEPGRLGARALEAFEMPSSLGWEEVGRHFYKHFPKSLGKSGTWLRPSLWELAPLSLLELFSSYDLHCVFPNFCWYFNVPHGGRSP